jgi:hypothetical protein
MLSCAAVPAKTCLVTVVDIRGVRHTAEVMSETLFEAAVLGLRALKRDGWMGEVGPATRLEVEVKEPTVTHVLSVQQIQRWLESTGKPSEQMKKAKLRDLLR